MGEQGLLGSAKQGDVEADLELCLDFTGTVDWRTSGHPEESLGTFSSLLGWCVKKGVVDEAQADHLGRSAKGEGSSEKTLAEAKALREALYGIFIGVARGGEAKESDLQILSRALAKAMSKASLSKGEGGYEWGWKGIESPEMVLFPIARSAARLLTSDDLGRVKECANVEEGCGSMFIDRSKGRSRRWCSMSSCGNKAKYRTYARKHPKE